MRPSGSRDASVSLVASQCNGSNGFGMVGKMPWAGAVAKGGQKESLGGRPEASREGNLHAVFRRTGGRQSGADSYMAMLAAMAGSALT